MSLLTASRTTQWPLVAEFTFDVTDTMANVSGATQSLSAAGAFGIIGLPAGAVVTGGSVSTEVDCSGGTGSALTVDIGDATTADRYTASPVDVTGAGSTALTLTGFRSTGENVQMTIAATGAYALGTVSVRVEYTMAGRSNEVQLAS